jgi:hypothetical protein
MSGCMPSHSSGFVRPACSQHSLALPPADIASPAALLRPKTSSGSSLGSAHIECARNTEGGPMLRLVCSRREIRAPTRRCNQFAFSAILAGMALLSALVTPASAQMNTCGMALQQLQMYVAQVNQAAQFEYQQGIPMRCRGNPMCGQAMLQQLNFWYSQQTVMVQNYYMQIASQCSSNSPTSMPRESDNRVSEHDVKTLDVDDKDRTVRIRIPSTPQGFVPQ